MCRGVSHSCTALRPGTAVSFAVADVFQATCVLHTVTSHSKTIHYLLFQNASQIRIRNKYEQHEKR